MMTVTGSGLVAAQDWSEQGLMAKKNMGDGKVLYHD